LARPGASARGPGDVDADVDGDVDAALGDGGGMAGCEITSKSNFGSGMAASPSGWETTRAERGFETPEHPDIKKAALNWRLWVLLRA